MTLWGETADKYDEALLGGFPVLAVKGTRVSDYGGRCLGASFGTQFFLKFEHPHAAALRAWYDSVGKDAAVTSLSNQQDQVGVITLASVNHSLFLPSFLSSFLTVPGRCNHARFCLVSHSPLLPNAHSLFLSSFLPSFLSLPFFPSLPGPHRRPARVRRGHRGQGDGPQRQG
jgi:hypothetical protein